MEILFRGKALADDKWYISSSLMNRLEKHALMFFRDEFGKEIKKSNPNATEIRMYVYPETLGLYTGYDDYKGTRIFTGDIIRFLDYDYTKAEVKFDKECVLSYTDSFVRSLK